MPRRPQEYVYVVIQEDIEHHDDDESRLYGSSHLLNVHKTLTSANARAKAEMLVISGAGLDDSGEHMFFGEEPQAKMVNGMYTCHFYSGNNERDYTELRVEKMPLFDDSPSPPPSPAPAKTQTGKSQDPATKKRKKEVTKTIDLLD